MNARPHNTEPSPAWLEEWQQHQACLLALDEELQAAATARSTGLRLLPSASVSSVTEEGPPVRAGQVRVLRPLPVTGAQDLCPVLVLQAAEGGERWICAPFSPLSEPAHDGEWRSPLAENDPRLSVLSLWDSAEIEGTLLVGARSVQQMGADALSAAQAVWSAWHHGTALPEHLAAETGACISRLLDPRHEYVAQTAGALQPWAELRRFSMQTATRRAAYSAAADSTLALAASPSGPQALGHTYRLAESDVRLVITLISPVEARLSVTDAAGQPSAMLDGGSLLFADGSQQAFADSELRVPLARLSQGFAVTEAGGALLSLLD